MCKIQIKKERFFFQLIDILIKKNRLIENIKVRIDGLIPMKIYLSLKECKIGVF